MTIWVPQLVYSDIGIGTLCAISILTTPIMHLTKCHASSHHALSPHSTTYQTTIKYLFGYSQVGQDTSPATTIFDTIYCASIKHHTKTSSYNVTSHGSPDDNQLAIWVPLWEVTLLTFTRHPTGNYCTVGFLLIKIHWFEAQPTDFGAVVCTPMIFISVIDNIFSKSVLL